MFSKQYYLNMKSSQYYRDFRHCKLKLNYDIKYDIINSIETVRLLVDQNVMLHYTLCK